jgi:hypothetical protein
MDMQFHWLCDRKAQGQFKIYWRQGGTNLADYFTKVNVRAEFLTEVKELAEARNMKIKGQTKTSSDTIAMLQGCVSQTRLQELAQQILARRENLNSLPEGFRSNNKIASTINR